MASPSPKGLKTWAAYGIEALRRLALSEQLRFSLDMLLDDGTMMRSISRPSAARLGSDHSSPAGGRGDCKR